MNRTELFTEVENWLKAEELGFSTNMDGASFSVRMNIDTGLIQVRLLCEESPATLQMICSVPLKVPKDKIAPASLLLHNLNSRLRFGAFHIDLEERIATFRLTLPVRQESNLQEQFCQAFGATLGTMDDNLPLLALYFCSTGEVRAAVAKLEPTADCLGTNPRLPGGRLELN